MNEKPVHVHEIEIRATPERVWEALTDGEMTRRYYYGTRIESDFQPGSRYAYVKPDGEVMLDGEILEIDPSRRVVMTFRPRWRETGANEVSRVTFTLEGVGDGTRLTMVHDRLDAESGVGGGWLKILTGLQRLLEAEPVPA